MIRAYDEQYLDDAQKNLGEAMEYAHLCCSIDMDEFLEMFIVSGIAHQYGIGNPKYVSGMSGTELVLHVLKRSGIKATFTSSINSHDFSSYYWCGWILAFYQWYTGRSFKDIHSYVSMADIKKLYPTLHEASELKFVDTVNSIIKRKNSPTRLQQQRKISGYSQRELAEKVGISKRTLEQYEIRAKDINKAAVMTLLALARVLGCRIEDLLENEPRAVEEK